MQCIQRFDHDNPVHSVQGPVCQAQAAFWTPIGPACERCAAAMRKAAMDVPTVRHALGLRLSRPVAEGGELQAVLPPGKAATRAGGLPLLFPLAPELAPAG